MRMTRAGCGTLLLLLLFALTLTDVCIIDEFVVCGDAGGSCCYTSIQYHFGATKKAKMQNHENVDKPRGLLIAIAFVRKTMNERKQF